MLSTQSVMKPGRREAAWDTADSIDSVAQLIVRGIEEEVVARLKVRAAKNGRSAEEEHRRILRSALADDSDTAFLDLLLRMPDVGEDEDFERPRDLGRPSEL